VLTRDRIRVLVIDDDELAREYLCEVLRFDGFTVFDLPTTIGVTNTIVRENISVVVLDVMMPTMRGDKLATLLRKKTQLSHLGVVLVSGCDRQELEAMAVDVNADAVVSKADVREQLSDAVLRATRRRPTIAPQRKG
jgi:DNA-binding response OmpR family regulator